MDNWNSWKERPNRKWKWIVWSTRIRLTHRILHDWHEWKQWLSYFIFDLYERISWKKGIKCYDFFLKESVCNKYFENSKLVDRDFDLCLFPLFRVLDIKGSRSERRMARASNVLTYHYLFLTPWKIIFTRLRRNFENISHGRSFTTMFNGTHGTRDH